MKKIWKLTSLRFEPGPVNLEGVDETMTTLEASGNMTLPHFTLLAYTGGIVKTKNFPVPLVVDMQGLDIPSQKIPVRYEHKSSQGVGHTEKIAIVGLELIAEGVISRETMWAHDIVKSAKNGFPWQASIGGSILEAEYIPPGQKVTVNGKSFEGELYVVHKLTLKEISFVDLGADSNTTAIVEAQFEEKDITEMKTETKIETPSSMRIEASNVDTEKMLNEFHTKMLIDQRRIAAIEKIGG
ncbi:MAG: hypothetical protein LBC02_12295, partial [Planctomycetaceae bacterium]|nr:hypothetical protein [Planctomycetaceae bacterium]